MCFVIVLKIIVRAVFLYTSLVTVRTSWCILTKMMRLPRSTLTQLPRVRLAVPCHQKVAGSLKQFFTLYKELLLARFVFI